MLYRMDEEVVCMNRVYKVIFNRRRQLVQVVPEYARNRGKTVSESRKGGIRGLAKVLLTFLATLMIASPGYAADGTEGSTGSGDTTATTDTAKQVVVAQGDRITVTSSTDTTNNTITYTISANNTGVIAEGNTDLVSGGTVYTAINGLQTTIGSLSTDRNYIKTANSVSANLSALDTQVKSNADAISKETTDRTNADTALGNRITSNAADIISLKELSNITTAGETVIKEQAKKAVKVAATGNATVTTTGSADDGSTLTYTINVAHDGEIKTGDTNLVSGGTMYAELRPASDGIYVKSGSTTATNLLALDTNLKNVIDAIGLDTDDTTTSYTSKLNKYFKVNPKETTSDDGKTKTYAPDAAANGTNSVAIGPSAQAGEKTTDATTSTATVTGGESSAAIGDSAKANGNQSVALGYNSQVLNTTDQDSKTTATITGSTAIGSGAKVNGATDATAIGTSAQVNETANGGIAFGKEAVTGEDKGTVTVGDATADVAAVGGENSVALGTSAKASGNTALALGNGAQVNNYTTQSGTTVTKTVNSGSTAIGSEAKVTGANDAVAFGSGASVTGTGTNADDSMAIGKSASVATAKDAMAFGTSAAVASGADNAIAVGNTAKANTSNTTAIGYNASATGAGAIAIGENTSTSTEGGISIGSGTSVSGKSIVIGYATDANGNTVKTESQNTDAVAIGNGAQANANDSISIGHQAGKDTNEGRTSGYGSLIAIGTNAGGNVKGMQNVALGSGAGSNVKSSYNVAIGSNAGSGINYAAAADSNPQDGYNISIGYEANYQSADANAKNIKESIAIGHSANAVSEATALGTGATASGDKSMALGYNAAAADSDSIALGDKASAGGGNIAIGSGSQAPAVASYEKGYLTGSTSVNGYISVGGTTSATGTTVLRRISNVADGSADQDAVTVAQLKAAYTDLEGTIKTTDTKISDTYTQSAIDSKISTVESKITASQTKYFSINPSSDTLTANEKNDGASTNGAADAMAIGPNATATSAKAVAIGNNVSASGKGSIALGTADNPATTGTVDAGNNTSANPHVTSAEGANSVAIGTSAIAQTDNSVALGTRASVYTSNETDPATNTTVKVGQQSIAIGYESETRNSNATSIGSEAKAYNDGSTAIGHSAYAQGADSVVIGTSSRANGASSGIVGKSNTINGSNTYAVGSENNVNGNWGAVTYSGLYGSKNIVNPVSDRSGNTKHGMDSLSVTGNSNTISQGSYSDTVQNISILGNSNSVTGASADEANAGTTANITVIGGNNEVTGRDGAGSDDMGKTWNQLTRTTVIGYKNTVNQAASTTSTSLADTQILGNDVTATLGNSVYLGTGSAAKNANVADVTTLTDAEQAAVNALDTTGMTDTEKAADQAKAKAAARYVTNLKTMKQSGTTAGLQSLSTDTTYDDGTSYTYAGSSPAGVVTVGTVGSERRLQNVAAGLVSATSTDAVNGSQLYALTRQLRFGGDNSIIGDTADGDTEVVKRGSGEALSIIGGAGVTTATVDGKTTVTVDSTKLTDNNIGVIADSTNNSLSVKLASDLKKLNTASLGSGSGDSYKETIKLDGTDTTNGGTLELKDATGANGVTLRTSGTTTTADVNGNTTTRLLVNDKTVATTDDGLQFGGDTGTDSALKLNNKLNVKGGMTDTSKLTENNIGVVSDGNGTLTVKLNKNVNLGTDGSLTTGAVTATAVTADTVTSGNSTLNTNGLTITNGPSVLATGINAGSKKITNVSDGEANADAANYGQVKAAKTILTQGNNTQLSSTTADDGHQIYTVNVDNLSYKAGTDTTARSVTLSNGLTFQNGKNTTAVAGDNGTITYNLNDKIELGSETDSNNHIVVDGTQGLITLGMDATINGKAGTASIGGVSIGKSGTDQVITGLTNKTWTVGTTQAVDGRAATENQLQSVADNLNTANTNIATLQHGFKVQANGDTTTESTVKADDALNFTAGNNAKVTTTKDSKQITISVDNLSVKDNNGTAQNVKLADGLNFQDGTNTNAKVGTSGTVTYDLKDSITLGNSTDETNRIIVNGINGTITAGNLATINGNAGTASIGGVSIGKSGSDQIVTGLSNTNWIVGTTKAVSGRAATEDQLQSVSDAAHTNADNITTLQQGFTVTANNDTEKKSTIKAGDALNIDAGKNIQISTTAESKSIEVAVSDTPEFTTVKAKDANGNITTVSGTGVTITPTGTGTQSVSLTSEGLDNGNHVIRNVASGGTVRTNAANIGDLQDAISNASTTATNTGFNVKGDDAAAKKVKLGKQLNVVGGTTDSTQLSTGNIGVETKADAEGNATLTVKLRKDIALDSVTTGSTTMNTTGISNGDMSLTNTGMIIKNNDVSRQVSITTSGVSMGSQQVKNVADGTDTKDAVNKGQLDVVQAQVTNGWQIAGSNGQKVADIGAGKKVTFGDTTYATASVQPDGTEGAKVTYTINTAALTADTATGKITEPTTDGVATAQNVAQAINNAAWKIKANDNEATAIKTGTTVGLKAGNNLTLSQSGTDFTYKLNDTLTGIQSLTTAAQNGYTTEFTANGVTITPSDNTKSPISLTTNGLDNGNHVIKNVASGGTERTNAANIGDLQDAISNASTTATNTGFNVKGDDATAQKVKLGKQLNVVGGVNDSTKLSDNNIGVVTTADGDGNATLTVKLNKDITLDSVKTGNTTLNTSGVTNGNMSLTGTGMTITDTDASKQVSVTTSGVSMGSQRIQNVADAMSDTDAATLKQVKNARTVVDGGSNVASVMPYEGANNQMTYTVNVDNLSVKANKEAAKSVTLKNGLTFNNGTNTTASVGDNGEVKYDLNSTLTGLTSVIAGNSTLNTNGLTITGGPSVLKSGINAGNQKITGVLDGTDTMDAVNKGQLDALANTVNGGWTIQAGNATGNAQIVKPGDKVTLNAGNNLQLAQDGPAFTYSLAEDLTGLQSVTAGDAKNNQAVLTGEGLKVTDKDGNSLTQHTTEIRLHSSNTDTADTSKDVVLDNSGLIVGNNIKFTNSGISAGNQKITGVADGELKEGSKEAVNGGQLYELKQQVGSGWKLTGDDTAQATNIGAGAQVSVKSGNFAKVTVNKSDSGATIQYDVQTQKITTDGGKAKTAKGGVATTQDVVDAINDSYWTVTSGQTGTGKATGTAVSNVTAGTAVTLQAGDNLLLNQAGNSFTYALNPVVTGMTSISFTGMGTGSDGKTVNDLVIGLQNGGGANPNKGYYITGLSNTEWNQSNYQGDRAATEAQLKKAIENVSIVKGGGGYGLTADEGANNGGDKNVTQALGNTIAVRGDGTYDENGKLVKAGNVKTVAYTDAAGSGQTGAIQIQLNKDINLGADGSLQAGGVTLKNNSVTVGTDGVVISSSGTDRTVSNLSNTQWVTAKANQEASAGGYIGSTKAATESQLQQAISQVTTTAQNNEQHIQTGEYTIGKNTDGTDRTDTHSVSMDVVDGQGKKQGSVVIKDVAKASEVGDVSQLHDNLSNPDGTKNVTGAINNLDTRVTGLDTQMKNIYTTAGQHSSVSAEDNIQVDSQSKNGTGGTDYKLSLNKEKIDLKNVTIEGNAGAVTAKTVTAEKYNVGDKTYISSDGLNANSQKITNVQAGTADTDAANVGQVRAADEQLAGGIEQNARNINQLGREVDKLDSRIDRVGAGAAALAALHPGAYDPNDKVDFSAGYGNYRGASAAAVGMYYHPDERTILSMGVAMGGGENMVNAGVTWKLGRRTPVTPQPVPVKAAPAAPALGAVSTAAAAPVRPAETAPVVNPAVVQTAVRPVGTAAPVAPAPVRLVQPAPALQPAPVKPADSNAQLMDLLARQTAILEKLAEQKAAPAAAPKVSGDDLFTDVPENHWAYACALKLEQAGALKGLNGLQVAGNPLLTRKDFAKILYTALKNGATTNPALNQDGSLNRMASEFRAELKEVKG